MNKIILVPAILGVMGIGGAIAVIGDQLIGSANTEKVLTLEQIEQKALAQVKGTIRDVEFNHNTITSYYEVEIVTADAEYDLRLDAVTGNLLSKKKDWLDFDDFHDDRELNVSNSNMLLSGDDVQSIVTTQKQVTQNIEPAQKVSNKAITQEQAVQIALAKVNGTVTAIEYDDDYQYDIEMVMGPFEYDFEIDALTGTIIKLEKDRVYD